MSARLTNELWHLLSGLSPENRHTVITEALSFLPGAVSEFYAVGKARAALAAVWESHVKRPVPIQALRRLRIGHSHAARHNIFAAADCNDGQTFDAAILSLIGYLEQAIANQSSRQRTLFPKLTLDAGARKHRPAATCRGMVVRDLGSLVDSGRQFRTIYADPPWPYDNEVARGAAAKHYSVMSLDGIRNEPVAALAAKNAHLHLWTTNGFLREALDLIRHWGFQYRSCFVWVKPDFGCGNYWRVSHEFLLLGVRGRLPFRDRCQPSWLVAPRLEHSRKPGRIRLLIESVSPGPYLELYGRTELPATDWTVYGNQVERRLF